MDKPLPDRRYLIRKGAKVHVVVVFMYFDAKGLRTASAAQRFHLKER